MQNTSLKKLVCLLLAAAQCLAPAFAQPEPTRQPDVSPSAPTELPTLSATPATTAAQPSQTATTAVNATAADAVTATGSQVMAEQPMANGSPAAAALRVQVQKTTATGDGQRYPDEVLRVVERSHTGMAVGLMVVGLFLGAGFLPPTKENNRGTKIATYPHPLFPDMAQSVSQWATVNKPDKKFKNPLLIRPDVFLLVYSDLTNDKTDYELQAASTISRKPDSGGWFTSHEKVNCSSSFNNEKMTLEQWQANDYAEVKKRMAVYSQECITTVVAALPKLLKD